MLKKSVGFSLGFILLIFLIGVYAQDSSDGTEDFNSVEDSRDFIAEWGGDCGDFDCEEVKDLIKEAEDYAEDYELEEKAGLVPSDALYFIDNFLDNFADDGKVREEAVAEMRAVVDNCKQGDTKACESFEKSFEKYRDRAKKYEKEVEPNEREEAERSSRAIRGEVIRTIAKDVPPTLKDDVVQVVVQENSIEKASEIAAQIFELCEKLSKIDPKKYYQVCDVDEDDENVPDWKVKHHAKLTKEQEKEAKDFFKVMQQCFETTSDGKEGYKCSCDDINIESFSSLCNKVAPLADRCDALRDEEACRKMEEKTQNVFAMLPPHLQEVMFRLENRDESNDREKGHGDFFPKECKDAGIKFNDRDARNKCAVVMVSTHAPPECKDKLLGLAEQGEVEERRFRETCDEIMMEIHAPDCAEEGITNPDECAEFMDSFRRDNYRGPRAGPSFPRECKETGIEEPEECNSFMFGRLPAEYQTECKKNDIFWAEDCRLYIEGSGKYSGRGYESERRKKDETGINFNCRSIEDDLARLRCYDEGTGFSGRGFKESDLCIGQREFDKRVGDCLASCPSCRWGGIMGDSGQRYQCTIDIFCKMERKEEWQGYDCALLDCQEGSHCEPDFGCVPDNYGPGGPGGEEGINECKNGCSDECPNADRTDCVAHGNDLICECSYEDSSGSSETENPEPQLSPEPSPESGEESNLEEPETTAPESGPTTSSETETSGEESSGSGSGSEGESRGEGGGEESPTTITGSFITGGAFLDYYYNWGW